MKKNTIILLLTFFGFVSCKQIQPKTEVSTLEEVSFTEIINDEYQLYKPNKEISAVLILFGGYPENAEDIKREFPILDLALENDIAVVLSNFNQKLWLNENDKHKLAKSLQSLFQENNLATDNIYIGGFSSGGVVSILISNFIAGMKQYYIDPKGVFIVDAPIDLAALYDTSENNLKRNFSPTSVQESTWLLETLRKNFGTPQDSLHHYENKAVYTYRTGNISNWNKLKQTKIRLYTEPDTIWWKENRMASYQETNAFYIKKMFESLKENGFEKVAYIPTKDKGYRANGDRHPHSWSIVDKNDLIKWILNDSKSQNLGK